MNDKIDSILVNYIDILSKNEYVKRFILGLHKATGFVFSNTDYYSLIISAFSLWSIKIKQIKTL